MECNKLVKEAFEGIEFRYKLDDTLENLGNQKFTATQLEGYLKGKGVSPKEIKQSGLLKGFDNDNRAIPADEWLAMSGDQRLSTTTLEGGEYGSSQFDNISLGKKGVDNETYRESLTGVVSPRNNIPKEPHFANYLPNVTDTNELMAKSRLDKYMTDEQANGRTFIEVIKDEEYKNLSNALNSATKPDKPQSLLGWRRTHIDNINGKKTLVLNEFQSDWAQTERAGRSTFESTSNNLKKEIHSLEKEQQNLFNKASDAWLSENKLTLQQAFDKQDSGILEFNDEVYKYQEKYFSSDATRTNSIFNELDTLDNKLRNKHKNIVADFPMSDIKHHQYQIVGAINDAIKDNIDTIAIPIQRENELVGSKGVTSFYENLNIKILPDIRKKLEKQGLKISVAKKPYSQSKNMPGIDTILDEMPTFARDNDYGSMDIINSKLVDFESENGIIKSFEDLDKWAKDFEYEDMLDSFLNTFKSDNDLWTLTIDELPNTKVKWDVYSLLSGLGLAGYATQGEANNGKNLNPFVNKQKGQNMKTGEYDEASDDEIKQYFADIESYGGDYKAFNKGSGAYGKYQITPIMMKDLGITRKDLLKPEKQEEIMNKLIPKYKARLEQFNLPVNKESLFVLHNLGMTGGIRVLKGHPSDSDIHNMRGQLPSDVGKKSKNEVITNYSVRYNI